MIPQFPNFKKIEIEDKLEIEKFTSMYEPFSDFNFTSLWSWDVKDERMVSLLNGNLVVRFTDYGVGNPFFSFLGTNEIENTMKTLIGFAKETGVSDILKFIPEDTIKNFTSTDFFIEEDRDNFDYIFSIFELVELKGQKFKEKRNLFNRFVREYREAVFELKNLDEKKVHEQILLVLNSWATKKELDNKEYDLEYEEIAIRKLLSTYENHNLIISCVLLKDEMIAFSVDEIMPNGYALSHFFKANNSYIGIYDFFNQKVSEYLLSQNTQFWNWEQDLGIENLRKSKMSHNPIKFLKKYKVSLTYK